MFGYVPGCLNRVPGRFALLKAAASSESSLVTVTEINDGAAGMLCTNVDHGACNVTDDDKGDFLQLYMHASYLIAVLLAFHVFQHAITLTSVMQSCPNCKCNHSKFST